jgi:hypothetical protein
MPMALESLENGGAHNLDEAVAPDVTGMSATMVPNFAVPNPDADWLFQS